MIRRNQSHIMVTLKGIFKGETGEKWHMMPLVDVAVSGTDIRKWVGRWLGILVDEEGRTECWVFQHREGDRMKTSDMDEGFQQELMRVNMEEVGLIPE